jgi:hypothetical protein
MKKILSFAMLTYGLTAFAADAPQKNPLLASDKVAWAGLDYSMVRMIGPNDFRNPEEIFPRMPESWNNLFVRERIRKLSKELGKQVLVDTGGMAERNALATAKQIIPTGGPEDVTEKSHITPNDIAAAVKSYKLENKSGLGLVFIVDRLVKPAADGAVYVVYFDIASREVISSERKIGWAGGVGFRNYWFGVIKNVEAKLKRTPLNPTSSKGHR